MAYPEESQKFILRLPDYLWDVVDEIAKKKGYKTTRRYINAEIRSISKRNNSLTRCRGKKDKKAVLYMIPDDQKGTLQNLSCILSTSIASILLLHMLPEILDHLRSYDPSEPSPNS